MHQRTRSNHRWRRAGLVAMAAVATAVAASGAVALAASDLQVHVSVPKTVKTGHKFTVTLHGFSQKGSGRRVYLDHRKCAPTLDNETQQDGKYQPGHPYFPTQIHGDPPRSTSHDFQGPGHFKDSTIAHAGTITGSEYVCAYISGDTAEAHAGASYKVTK